MNLDRASIGAFCAALRDNPAPSGVRVGVFPPSVYLAEVVAALAATDVVVGAQTCHSERSGAFTGEIAASMVKDVGASHVILGHSERRHVFGESDGDVRLRMTAALAAGLDVILCVGETIAQREAGATAQVVLGQLDAGLAGLEPATVTDRVTVAYEPVWAIGTGHTATPDQAQDVHAQIRARVAHGYGSDVADKLIIQYGGSVKPANVSELMACPDVDGALVGGASLDPNSFDALLRFES